jgi:glycosyltransferase involved in cell wall biosynthesis
VGSLTEFASPRALLQAMLTTESLMRILVLTTLFPNPYQPGRAVWNEQQFAHLAQLHPVEVIAPIAWTDELKGRWRGHARMPAERITATSGLKIHHPPFVYVPRVIRSHGVAYLRSVRSRFDSVVKDFLPDLVLASWAYPDGWAGVRLAREAGLPAIVKVHGCDVLALPRYPSRRRHTVEALTRADGIIAVSKHLAERVVQLGADPERVSVVNNGVDGQLFHPGSTTVAQARLKLPDTRPLILFIGNLDPVKGLETLIAACSILKERGVPFQCVMIGEGSMRSVLQRQIKCRGLEKEVQLPGSLPQRQLPDWYRAATVFALPSRSEGLPNVLLEALACGTPWVASSVGGIPEIADLGANRLVPAGDATGFAAALEHFLTQDQIAQRPKAAIPAITWDDSARSLEECLRRHVPKADVLQSMAAILVR